MKERPKSQEVFRALKEVIPGGVNSPVRSCKGLIDPPVVVESGEGDSIIDVDGNRYIDYCGSWGSLIHGHAHPTILKAVEQRIRMGTSFGITTAIEEKLARKIVTLVPSVDKLRFVSSGTEATMTAVRLARGFTGKNLVIKFSGNYHGHSDSFLVKAGSGVARLSQTSSSAGIPAEMVSHTICLSFNDIESTLEFFKDKSLSSDLAAVILEPVAANMGVVPAKFNWIEHLREETKKCGALLIFDEVISGFRMGIQGAQGMYGIRPDLSCYGKIIGGGFPAAAFGGRRDVMDYLAPLGPVYQAGTLSGNPVAMEAGLQALKLLEKPGFYDELLRKTNIITEPLRDFIENNDLDVAVQQVGSIFTVFFRTQSVQNFNDALKVDDQIFGELFRYMLDKGVYIPPSPHEAWFISDAHTEENLCYTRDHLLAFLKQVSDKLTLAPIKA